MLCIYYLYNCIGTCKNSKYKINLERRAIDFKYFIIISLRVNLMYKSGTWKMLSLKPKAQLLQ